MAVSVSVDYHVVESPRRQEKAWWGVKLKDKSDQRLILQLRPIQMRIPINFAKEGFTSISRAEKSKKN